MYEMRFHGKDCLCRENDIGCANIHGGNCEDCAPTDCVVCDLTVPRCTMNDFLECSLCQIGCGPCVNEDHKNCGNTKGEHCCCGD